MSDDNLDADAAWQKMTDMGARMVSNKIDEAARNGDATFKALGYGWRIVAKSNGRFSISRIG